MFVKIEGSYINLALDHSIDLNDDGTATLWFAGADGACWRLNAAVCSCPGLFTQKRRFKAPFCFIRVIA